MNSHAHQTESAKNGANNRGDLVFVGRAHAPRVPISAPSPKSSDIIYSSRALPHFERPWGKYAVAFTTHARQKLTRKERDLVLRSAVHGHEHHQYELYVACVMPDHVHLLFEPQPKEIGADGKNVFWSLSEILQGIKSSTAHRINKARAKTGPVWEKESFDRLIRSETDLQEKFAYICRNPWDSKVAGRTKIIPGCGPQEVSSAGAPKVRAGLALAREGACASPDRMMIRGRTF